MLVRWDGVEVEVGEQEVDKGIRGWLLVMLSEGLVEGVQLISLLLGIT